MMRAGSSRTTRRGWAITTLLVVLVTACGGAATPQTSGAAPNGSGSANSQNKCATLKPATMIVGGAPATSPILELVIPEALGYYESEACVKMTLQTASTSLSMVGGITSGQVQYSNVHPSAALSAQAAQSDVLPTVQVCAETHKTTWAIVVRPDSTIASVKDLRGKKIAVPNFSNSEAFGIKAALALEGIDPDRDAAIIQANYGASLGNALTSNQVDAIVAGDTEIANITDLGFKFKRIPDPEVWKGLSVGYGPTVRREYYNANKAEIAGVCRAVAMGQIFALTNPEAAVKLFWKMFPESKGAGGAEDLRHAVVILSARMAAWTACGPVAKCPNFRYGDVDAAGWRNYVKYLGLNAKIPDVSKLFTNEFVDEINKIDVDAVVRYAQSYQFKD